MKKILISTGGTGGHVIPAQVISDHLKINFGIIFTSDTRGLKYFKERFPDHWAVVVENNFL